MPRLFRALTALCVAAIVFAGGPALALAAPAEWDAVEVIVHTDSTPLTIVSGTLPDSTPLPAKVELAAPAGSEIGWAGEILGGDTSADPEVQYTVARRGNLDVYSFTLTKARTGQIEFETPDVIASASSGLSAETSWTAPWPIRQLTLSVRVPQGTRIVEPSAGATMSAGPPGFVYYGSTAKDVKAHESIALAFTFQPPAATDQAGTGTAAGQPGSNDVVAYLIVGLILVVGSGWIIAARARAAADQDEDAPAAVEADDSFQDAGAQLSKVDGDAAGPRPRGKRTALLVVGVLVAGLVAGMVLADRRSSASSQIGTELSRTYSSGEVCTTTRFALASTAGANLEADAQKVLDSIQGVEGVRTALMDVAAGTVDVGFCSSSTDEQTIATALGASGYRATSMGTPTSAGSGTPPSD